MDDLAILDNEFAWLDDFAARIITLPGAHGVRVSLRHAVGDWESNIGACLFRLVFRINRPCNDRRAQCFQFRLFLLNASQLPAAIGSPVAAVEQDDPVSITKTIRQIERSTIDEIKRHFGEG